jgi:hypothetical protein
MDDVKTAYAWQEAMKLAQKLSQVCEDFSDSDRNVLVAHLRQAVVEIPATIAVDLKFHRMATMEPVIRLATALELVHRIYPAVDTGQVALMDRMSTDRFNERELPKPDADQPNGAATDQVAIQTDSADEDEDEDTDDEPSAAQSAYGGATPRPTTRVVPIQSDNSN